MGPVNATVIVGETVTFNCSFDGYPFPDEVSLEGVCVCVCVCVCVLLHLNINVSMSLPSIVIDFMVQ